MSSPELVQRGEHPGQQADDQHSSSKGELSGEVLLAVEAPVNKRKNPKHIPIAYKLSLFITLLITVSMGLLGFLIVNTQTKHLGDQIADFGLTIAQQMAATAREPLLSQDLLTLKLITNNVIANQTVSGAAIYSDEKRLLTEGGIIPSFARENFDPALLQNPPPASPLQLVREVFTGSEGQHVIISYAAPVLFRDLTVGHVLVSVDRTHMQRFITEAIRAIIVVTLVVILLGIMASYYLGKRLAQPIHQVIDASKKIAQGDYTTRLHERRNDELGLLMQSMNAMSDGLFHKEQVEKAFSRYVSPKVASEVIANLDTIKLGGHHVQASVLFADIVGFTSLSERLEPEQVSTLLNTYFTPISQAAHLYNGHVDKYIGDCAMIVFGVPGEDKQHIHNAMSCAVMIMRLVEAINRKHFFMSPIEFRIGVNSGTMLAGNMGSMDRMEYTVVGDAVNLASRLASAAQPGQILVTEAMIESLPPEHQVVSKPQEQINIRGKKEPVTTYSVRDVGDADYQEMLDRIEQVMNNLELGKV